MSSAVVHSSVVEAQPVAATRQRVLILRSCRAVQFLNAVSVARRRHPAAEIVALSHRGHAQALMAAGVDRVIEIPGRRFGLLRIAPWRLARLRVERFEEVIVPQMTPHPDLHVNLYWIAAALRPRRVVVLAAEREPQVFGVRMLARHAAHHALTAAFPRLDAVWFVLLLIAANLVPRRPMPAPVNRRRRVLHVISSLGVGGAQVQLAELINRTPATEYDVELLVLGGADGDFSRQWLRRDVSVSYLEEWPRLVPSVREIVLRCRRERYDVVHTWLFMANCVGVAAARLAGVPLVIASVRNLSVWKRQWWYRTWWTRIADMLGSRAADVVTVNATALVEDHARWARMPQQRIEVVHNGLDPSHFTASRADGRRALLDLTGAPAGATLIGTVGRLAYEKDHETFLEVLARVRKRRPDVHGVVIGDGDRMAPLEQRAAALGLTGAVSFLGRRADARQLAAGFDLFLLTSRSEGFPNVLLEATFHGVPCLATDLAGNPEVLGSDESLFPAGDAERGASRVLHALADPGRTRARASAARTRALARFTSDRSVAAWLDLYRRHIGAKAGRPAESADAASPRKWRMTART
jgi:glycosyltransferase involved in cell wall biosynthesis